MIRVKDGVKLSGLRPEILLAIYVIDGIYESNGINYTYITSCTDGKHGRGSLHYVGLAVDIRTNIIPSQGEKDKIREQIAYSLGQEYDVVLESTHLHIEYQPK